MVLDPNRERYTRAFERARSVMHTLEDRLLRLRRIREGVVTAQLGCGTLLAQLDASIERYEVALDHLHRLLRDAPIVEAIDAESVRRPYTLFPYRP